MEHPCHTQLYHPLLLALSFPFLSDWGSQPSLSLQPNGVQVGLAPFLLLLPSFLRRAETIPRLVLAVGKGLWDER